MADSGQDQVSPQVLRGLAIAWVGIVALSSLCIILGMGWGEQEAAPAFQVVTPSLASLGAGQATTVFSETASVAPEVTSDTQSILPPNQELTFGYGIEIYPQQGEVVSTLDKVQELGLGWIKYRVDWASMEPSPDAIRWDELDAVMSSASAHNIKVLLVIASAPAWTRSVTTTGKNGPPDEPQRYANFLLHVLQRYQGAIHAVEIWNEQNLGDNWYTAGGVSPTSYMELLIPSSQVIRQFDPGIIIISGALTPTGQDDGVGAIDDFRYMQEMLAAGALNYVDCVGARHIGFNLAPTISSEDAFFAGAPVGTRFIGPYDTTNPVNPHHSWSFYSTLNGYHSMVVAMGQSIPLCVTEFGWAAAEDGEEAVPGFEFAYDNTPQEQSDYIVQAFQSMHDGKFVRLGILFNLDYASNDGGVMQDPGSLFSVLSRNGSPRPAYQAIQDMPKEW
jgi:polysaccharide biosynthesis protein PslG